MDCARKAREMRSLGGEGKSEERLEGVRGRWTRFSKVL